MKFQEAVQDYRYLRNRGFPAKASLKLVGDRYLLDRMERNCLFRGVVPHQQCRQRLAKICPANEIQDQPLGIDWYNVLITVESYLKGAPVFLTDDGVLRDSAGIHGSYHSSQISPKATDSILKILYQLKPARIDLYLDAPIPHSGDLASALRRKLASSGTSVNTPQSADYILKDYPGIVATSDSNIMDSKVAKIFDLARYVLEQQFGFQPFPLSGL